MHTSSRPRLLNVFTNKGTKFKLQNITDLELGTESESESVSEIACEQYMVRQRLHRVHKCAQHNLGY